MKLEKNIKRDKLLEKIRDATKIKKGNQSVKNEEEINNGNGNDINNFQTAHVSKSKLPIDEDCYDEPKEQVLNILNSSKKIVMNTSESHHGSIKSMANNKPKLNLENYEGLKPNINNTSSSNNKIYYNINANSVNNTDVVQTKEKPGIEINNHNTSNNFNNSIERNILYDSNDKEELLKQKAAHERKVSTLEEFIDDDDVLNTNEIDELDIEEGQEYKDAQKSPNPTIKVAGKSRHSLLSGLNQGEGTNKEYIRHQSGGSIVESSVKPRKGDQTPKSNDSFKLVKDELAQNLSKPNTIRETPSELNNNPSQSNPKISTNENKSQSLHQQNISEVKDRLTSGNRSILDSTAKHKRETSQPSINQIINESADKRIHNSQFLDKDNHFGQYDIQQLTYDLVKEYSHLKIDKDESFMRRMLFDIFKRQTKDERMTKLIEKNKVKIDENDRVKTFNRLIEDANRRLEAQEKMDKMKDKLNEYSLSGNGNRRYKEEEWEEIYEDRFIKFKNERDKKLEDKIKDKYIKEKEKEEVVIDATKAKKVPHHVLNQIVNRMYDEAERRKLKMEERIKREAKDEEGEEKDRELTPSKFKKFKKSQNYNFQVILYLI